MTGWIAPFLKSHGITSEIGPCSARDQHGNEYELLVVPFAGSESAGHKLYKAELEAFMQGHVHIIWRWEPQVESASIYLNKLHTRAARWEARRIYSRLSRYPERP
jgi:hypothetical protein